MKFIVFLMLMILFIVIDAASTARGLKPKPLPISVVTSDSTPDVGQMVTLTVDNTSDPNPKWVLGKKQFRYGRSISVSWPIPGQYTLVVIAKDLRGKIKRSSIQITVTVQPPIINVFLVPAQSLSLDPVVFNAQATDPSGQPVNYVWDFGDGQSSTNQNPTHSYNRPGSYTVKLTITDASGTSVSQESPITILNRPPIALFSTSTIGWWIQTIITFDSHQSNDLDGQIVACRWDMGDGTTFFGSYPDLATVTYQYRRQASYPVTLIVTDDLGSQASRSETIIIGNRNPIAKVTANETTIMAGKTVIFNGSTSSDPDNDNLTYAWSFGDNTTGTGSMAEHQYITVGTYTPALTVTDDWGATATASITITVTPPPPPPRWPQTPGHTEFKLLRPSRLPTYITEIKLIGIPIEQVRIDDKDNLWIMPRFIKLALPSGSIISGPVLADNEGWFVLDRSGNIWVSGSSSTPSIIDKYTQSAQLLKRLQIGVLGNNVIDIDRDGFIYLEYGTGGNNGRESKMAIIDTLTDDFVHDQFDNIVTWPLPNRAFALGAIAEDGVNLWLNNSWFGSICHVDRIDGSIIKKIKTTRINQQNRGYVGITIGPNNEIILSDPSGREIVALDPQAEDDTQPLWSIPFDVHVGFVYHRNGILVINVFDGIQIRHF